MPGTVLIGAQWGDEGKGKIIDVLAAEADVIVRFQGGNNAGHTVEIGAERYVLHLVPSGIFRPDKICVIGNGVVVDPPALTAEIRGLEARGISVQGRLFVSDRAHAVFPYHRALDEGHERARRAGRKIGTTRRGIGPCYADKIARIGLRLADMLDPGFPENLRERLAESNEMLAAMGAAPLDAGAVLRDYVAAAAALRPYVADTVTLLNEAAVAGKSLLFEGAQGTMLDVDFGTYPFVTSSNASAGGACTGTGVPMRFVDRVVGLAKAYTTRVGEGPFPTELDDETGRAMGERGREFGATTGRPRRCGWFDAVVARYSAVVNGIDYWALTKLDVLDELPVIRICVAYEQAGRRYDTVPAHANVLAACRPVYEEVEGWRRSTREVTRYADLPAGARAYVDRICELTGVPLGILSLGPRRQTTIRVGI